MNAQSPIVLVLGARGRFGACAVQAFAAAGWTVLAQARPSQATAAGAVAPAGVRPLSVDLADTERLAAAAHGARAVVYAVNPPYTEWPAQALPLARQGLAVAERVGATFMLPGNVYNFGADMPALLREDTPQHATTRKGALRVAMEAELQARAARGLRSVVIRAGDFFGGGSGSWLDLAITKDLRRGRLVYPGPLDRAHAWAYLPDLARAFVAAASHDALPAFTRLHFAGHTLTGAQCLAAVERAAEALGLAPRGGWRHGGMPWRLIRAGGLVVPIWREIAEMAYLWQVPHALDGQAMRDTLGELPHTDIELAMRQTLIALGHAVAATPATATAGA